MIADLTTEPPSHIHKLRSPQADPDDFECTKSSFARDGSSLRPVPASFFSNNLRSQFVTSKPGFHLGLHKLFGRSSFDRTLELVGLHAISDISRELFET
jgi:hypothetical protein